MANEHILIVDDDEDLVGTLTTVLESAGYRCSSASDGTEAREKVQQSCPDLAIVDVIMDTVGEGVQLTQWFREDPRFRDVRIIMLTGIKQKVNIDIRPHSEEAYGFLPVDTFLEKPVDPDVLLKEVRDLL